MTISTQHLDEATQVLRKGDELDPAMLISTEEDARIYLAAYVAYLQRIGNFTHPYAQYVAQANIRYYCGYFSDETYERVHRVFRFE